MQTSAHTAASAETELAFLEEAERFLASCKGGSPQQDVDDALLRLRQMIDRKRAAAAAGPLLALARRVAHLNPDAGEIGAGMLASLVIDAHNALTAAGERP